MANVKRRGFSEPVVHVYNPLPDVSDAEILERAGLDLIDPATRSPWICDWRYSGHDEREWVHLKPGEFLMLRKSELPEFMNENRELGMVVVDDPQDPESIRKATIKGLTAAYTFFKDRGKVRLLAVRKTHGFTAEEMEENRHEHWAYYYNQAKADIIAEVLKDLRAKKPAKSKSKD
jgi:hypothetical protein